MYRLGIPASAFQRIQRSWNISCLRHYVGFISILVKTSGKKLATSSQDFYFSLYGNTNVTRN